jgi:hypothetical protein
MKTTLKYIEWVLRYTFIFSVKLLWGFLKLALHPNVIKETIKEEQRQHLERIYRMNNCNPIYRPDNPANPIKKLNGW